jgi:hypothetical protein
VGEKQVSELDRPYPSTRERIFFRRLKTAKGNFRVLGVRRSNWHSLTQQYAKMSVNEQEKKKFDAWVEKNHKSGRLQKSYSRNPIKYREKIAKMAAKDKAKPPTLKIVVRTHNKEYWKRISTQMDLLKKNDTDRRAFIRRVTKIAKALEREAKRGGGKDLGEIELMQLIDLAVPIVRESFKGFEGEEFILQKPKSPAGKLAKKRQDFFNGNYTLVFEAFKLMGEKGLLTERQVWSAIDLITKEARKK